MSILQKYQIFILRTGTHQNEKSVLLQNVILFRIKTFLKLLMDYNVCSSKQLISKH